MPLGTSEDHRRMGVLRAASDAVIIGAATFRAAPIAAIEAAPRTRPLWNVVLSRSLDLPLDAFRDTRVKWLVATAPNAPPDRAAKVRAASAEVLELQRPTAVLEALQARGAQRVLLETGGDSSAPFFQAGRVDEIFLTVTPLILGARGAPSPVDGAAFAAGQWPRFKLAASETVGDEV